MTWAIVIPFTDKDTAKSALSKIQRGVEYSMHVEELKYNDEDE